jgi:DNA-binding beta-propeller fold protein YncE
MKFKHIAFALLSSAIATLGSTGAIHAQTVKVISVTPVAEGLDNARGIGFSPDGALLVTETGIGGDGACIQSPSVQNQPLCSGRTAAITRVKNGRQSRIVTDMPSLALQPTGLEGAGPQDIKFDANGRSYLVYGFAGDPVNRDTVLGVPRMAKFYEINLQSPKSVKSIADLGSYELAANPDKGDVITNPYAFAFNGNKAYIVDAGANDVLSVDLDTKELTLLTALPQQIIKDPIFPPPDPSQAPPSGAPPEPPSELSLQSVPTGIAVGSDGSMYVSEFTGFPYPENKARIFRITKEGDVSVVVDDLTQLADLEFDAAGNLYVLQYANESAWKGNFAGSLIQIKPDGTRTTLLSGNGLESPTALAIGPDGAIYISNRGDLPDVGQVLRVQVEPSIQPAPWGR